LRDYWWYKVGEIDQPHKSGLISYAFVREQKNFAQIKKGVWKWYRSCVGNKKLNTGAKLVLWALVERFRMETFSSHDSITYYAKMVGMNRRSVGRSIQELVEKEIIWCVLEDQENIRLKKSQTSGKKHYLFVGLGVSLIDEKNTILT
jgi:hypothetical protein